jgi:hypothetical protein
VDKEKYLVTNKHILDLKNTESYADLHFLDSTVKTYKFFLFGEIHNAQSNNARKIKFLKYLHRTANVRHLFIEYPYSAAYIYNQFLKTGNDSLLKIVHTRHPEDITFFKQLYQFNQTIAPAEQIDIFGADFEIDFGREKFFLVALKDLVVKRSKGFSPEITPIINKIKRLVVNTDKKVLFDLKDEIKEGIENDSLPYKQFFQRRLFSALFDGKSANKKRP